MEKKDWAREATNILKAEMARNGLSYSDMLEKLSVIGINEDYKSLANKIGRGTFSFIFFMQCMKALNIKTEAYTSTNINISPNNETKLKEMAGDSHSNIENLTIPFAKLEARAEMLAEENERLKNELEQCRIEAKNTRDLYTSTSAVLRVTEEQIATLQQEKKLLLEKIGEKNT